MTKESHYPKYEENSFNNLLNEPLAIAYGLSRISIIRQGLSLSSLLTFLKKTGLTRLELAPILNISARTLQRQEDDDTLSPAISERLLMLNDLYQLGYQALGQLPKNTTDWLREPNPALNNEKPLDYLDTYQGIQEIKNLLGRIIHGVYS